MCFESKLPSWPAKKRVQRRFSCVSGAEEAALPCPGQADSAVHGHTKVLMGTDGLDLMGPGVPPSGTLFLYRKEETPTQPVSSCPNPTPSAPALGLPEGSSTHTRVLPEPKGSGGGWPECRGEGGRRSQAAWAPVGPPLVLGTPGMSKSGFPHLETGQRYQCGRSSSMPGHSNNNGNTSN